MLNDDVVDRTTHYPTYLNSMNSSAKAHLEESWDFVRGTISECGATGASAMAKTTKPRGEFRVSRC